jgi:hypothetical protein
MVVPLKTRTFLKVWSLKEFPADAMTIPLNLDDPFGVNLAVLVKDTA